MFRRTTLAATAALAGALTLTGTANAATISPAQAAGYGAGWLGRELEPTGYVASLGGPDYNVTGLAVLALVSAKVGEDQAAAATSYLFAHVNDYVVGPDTKDRPAALATLILVAHARGLDPSALVTRLLATKQASGADAGLFGDQDATYDGAYRQALGLLALAAVGQTDAAAVAWLKAEQCADGGWMGNRPDQAAPCPAFDMTSFVGEDSNGTALAAQALAALGETPNVDPLGFLTDAQNDDGGFAYTPGLGSDANSTALAVQALIAAGEDLGDWAAPHGTPYAFLLALQSDSGGFAVTPGTPLKPNALATVQVVPALAGQALPIAPATLSHALPAFPVAPVASPTPTPTAKPTPTALPTRIVDAAPVPTLPATGNGRRPWDATGQAVLGAGLLGYGLLALGGARLARRRG